MNNLDLSIVIRCKEDRRVFRCIESIDEDVEIIVSTIDNPVFLKELESRNIKYCISPPGNLSHVSNIGVEAASNDKVIITDSDTIFEKGTIRAMEKALHEHMIVRARLKFLVNDDVPLSNLVAEARDYVNSLPVTYTPGLGVRKEVRHQLGGFLFNDPVPFAVDADLNYRVQFFGVSVKFLESSIIYHDTESLNHDLKTAFRIGSGCMTSALDLSEKIHKGSIPPRTIIRRLKGVRPKHMVDLIGTKGTLVFFYQMIWDIVFHSGKNWQRLKAISFKSGQGV